MTKSSLGSRFVRAYNCVSAQWRRLRSKKEQIVDGCCKRGTAGSHNRLSRSVGGRCEPPSETIGAPADPLPAYKHADVAGPFVLRFVAWLLPQIGDEAIHAVELEYLFYEFASVEDQPQLESAVLFEILATHGLVGNETPRDLQPHEWRYRHDIRRGIKRPQVDTYRIVPQTVCTASDGTEYHWIDASDGAFKFAHARVHPVRLYGRLLGRKPSRPGFFSSYNTRAADSLSAKKCKNSDTNQIFITTL